MEQTVVTKTKHKRRPKTSDSDIKEFFQDYKDAKNAIHKIKKHLISRPLTQEEVEEIQYLEEGMRLYEDILNCFPEREKYVLQQFYLEHRKLFLICLDICYGYEYTSYIKIQSDISLRRWLSGNVINSTLGLKLMEQVRQYLSTATIR